MINKTRTALGLVALISFGCNPIANVVEEIPRQNTPLRKITRVLTDGNEPTELQVWHHPTRQPMLTDPYVKAIYARHMGPNFDFTLPSISADTRIAKTGIDSPLRGATQNAAALPTFVTGDGKQFGYYADTKEMESLKLFPFEVSYCKAVGLGAPQLSVDKNLSNLNVFPWDAPNKKLEISIQLQVPVSEVKVRKPDGTYEIKPDMTLGEHGPVYIASSYLYLMDVTSGKLIAVLFNYFDPRGALPAGVSNDNQVFFFSSPLAKTDMNGNSLTSYYTVEEGEIQRRAFRGFRTFRLTISQQQLTNIIELFGPATTISTNPADYRVQSAGTLNEVNYLYQHPASNCVPDYDPNTYAKVGMSYREFTVRQIEDDPPLAAYDLRGYFDGVYLGDENDFYTLGWACATGVPQAAKVELSAGNTLLTRLLAEVKSEPAVGNICLEKSAYHRFSYRLSASELKQFSEAKLFGTIIGPDGAKSMDLPNTTSFPTTIPKIIGYLDGLDSNGLLRGWSCAKRHPQGLAISIYAGDTKLGSVKATFEGESAIGDLCGAGKDHRFEYKLSASQVAVYRGREISAVVEVDNEKVFDTVKFDGINYTIGR